MFLDIFENNFILNSISIPQNQLIFLKSEEFLDDYIEEMKRIKLYFFHCMRKRGFQHLK